MNIQTVFKGAVLLGVLVSAGGLRAEALVITSDVTNWEGLTLPDAGEEIIIKDGVTAKVTTRAALEAIKDCSRIRPETSTSRFEVQVPAGETWTNFCPMSAVNLAGAGNKDFAKGEIYKTGDGTLCLKANNRLIVGTQVGNLTIYDWWTCLTVAEGTLCMPTTDTDGTHYVGYVTVADNATFCIVENTTTYVRGLFGSGTIANAHGTKTVTLMVMNEQNVNLESDFYGQITGRISIGKYKNGELRLHGTNSTNTGNGLDYDAVVGAAKIGDAGEASSIGAGSIYYLRSEGEPTLRYLGAGETAGKELNVYQHATRRAYLDGGPYGGLVWGGNIRPNSANGTMRSLVLTGTNAEPCVVSGSVYGNYQTVDKDGKVTAYDGLYLEKEGSGTWRFADHAERKFATGFGIREGVLAFDSLDEQGRLSSLGVATNLTAAGGTLPLARVDYAYTLGSTTETATPAVFAYTGTNGFSVTTRPIALTGKGGHLRNDTARRIRFRGVSSLGDEGVKTLTLDGSGANTNEVADITDGAGTTGVTKDSTGTWCLSGDLTFKGPLEVKKGTLIVRKTQPGVYKWFRWTAQEKHTKSDAYDVDVNIAQIGLFDEAGAVQSKGLTMNGSCSELESGQFGFQTVRTRVAGANAGTSGQNPSDMFSGKQGYGMWSRFFAPGESTAAIQHLNDPSSWFSVVMRLPDTAQQIAYFDFMNVWYPAQGARSVKTSSLEGSVDGLHWNMLIDKLEVPLHSASWTWGVSGNCDANTKFTYAHTDGAPVAGSTDKTYSVLTGNPFVSVAPGAKLVADGDLTIKNLTLDGEKGMGTLDGFAFDESGTINIVGDKAKFLDKAPADIRGATVGRVSDWAVSVNGTLKPGWKVAASSDGIKIIKSGMLLLFR